MALNPGQEKAGKEKSHRISPLLISRAKVLDASGIVGAQPVNARQRICNRSYRNQPRTLCIRFPGRFLL